jgi:hypothetical protein
MPPHRCVSCEGLCAEHEFFAGPLLKQNEAFREHPIESKALLKQLVTEAAPCLTRLRK